MDFFGQQERAQASTKRLVILFALAVVLTNLAIYVAVAGVFQLTQSVALFGGQSPANRGWFTKLAHYFAADGFWNWELLGWVTMLVTTVVGLVTGYKLRQLSRGGEVVARLLGGRLVSLNTGEVEERRLLNVVEEMAIASGLPVPEVYVLDEENGINALAAGNEAADAVVGVTFGAMKLLNRDELQGVIAHEFSHIRNGDMRLNTRLIGWMHGLLGLVVLGRILSLNYISRARTAGGERVGPVFHPVFLPAFVLGWICIMAGSCGALVARLIKSAVSRQREYLADAAAVQFTRNPDGLFGALKKIGGLRGRSILTAARAEEASHMYFSDGMRPRWFGFLATHPPLTKRIQRINPCFDGEYPAVSLKLVLHESPVTALYREQGSHRPMDFDKLAAIIGPEAAAKEMLHANAARNSDPRPATAKPDTIALPEHQPMQLQAVALCLATIPDTVRAATNHADSAMALLYALLSSKEPETRARQIALLAETTEPGCFDGLRRLLPVVDTLEADTFLPLTELGVRALRQLSAEQYETFCHNLRQLVEADAQIDLFEYMLQRMIQRHLEPHFRKVRRTPVQFYRLKPLLPDCAVLLSGLARIGQKNENAAQAAFCCGAAQLTDDSELRLLPLTECNLAQIDAAIDRTAQATPQLRLQIFNALAATAARDGQLQKREAELLRAIADAFGSPIPPFLGGTGDLTATAS